MKVNSFSTQLSWKDWVKEMLHGKAITFYVYIILFGVNAFGEFYFGVTLLLRMLFFMVGIFTIGGLVDTVAHLYLGRNQSGLDAPSLHIFIKDVFKGRTHVIYGLIGGLILGAVMVDYSALIGLINIIGGIIIITDVVMARYYH